MSSFDEQNEGHHKQQSRESIADWWTNDELMCLYFRWRPFTFYPVIWIEIQLDLGNHCRCVCIHIHTTRFVWKRATCWEREIFYSFQRSNRYSKEWVSFSLFCFVFSSIWIRRRSEYVCVVKENDWSRPSGGRRGENWLEIIMCMCMANPRLLGYC